jgi:hypothetical protein
MGNESKIAESDPQQVENIPHLSSLQKVVRSGIWIEIDPSMGRDSAWEYAKRISNDRRDLVYMTQSGYCSMIVRPEHGKTDGAK